MFIDKIINQLQQQKALFIGEETAFRSAVLIPLVEIEGQWHILFEVRSFEMRKQPGDISFPGGKIDVDDASPLASALRETEEELGIKASSIGVIGKLSPFILSPSFVVYPFVGVVELTELSLNAEEVAEVFTVPVKWLMEHDPAVHLVHLEPKPAEDFPFEKISGGMDYKWGTRAMEEWFYEYNGYVIWGLTARILKDFIEKMRTA